MVIQRESVDDCRGLPNNRSLHSSLPLGMASQQVIPSSSRRPGDTGQGALTLGSFKRLEEIGRGSFATVYKASYSVSGSPSPAKRISHQSTLALAPSALCYLHISKPFGEQCTNDCPLQQKKPGYVAIKSVDMKKLNKKLKDNLYSEIHILKRLHHPHIVALIDCLETSAHIHLIMEFCELGDLSYFIKKRDTLGRHDTTADMIRKYPNPTVGGLNEVVVRHFVKQLSSALEFLREKDFIHRDVKPQNLLLDPSPEFYAKASPDAVPYAAHANSLVPATGISSLPTLKLADFGFARSLPSTALAETLCGSPLYMAPEILRYEKYDAKADLWSVGTVTYEMMVGKPPFRAANHVELLRKIEKGEDKIRFAEDIIVSDSMKRLVRGLLKRNPVERVSFADFFNSTVVKDEIPGLVEEDKPLRQVEQEQGLRPSKSSDSTQPTREASHSQRSDVVSKVGNAEALSQSPRKSSPLAHPGTNKADISLHRRSPGTPPSTAAPQVRKAEQRSDPVNRTPDTRDRALQARRPSIVSHATAPARPDLQAGERRNLPTVGAQRRSSREASSPKQSSPLQNVQNQDTALQERDMRVDREAREARERAAQDVAFERDYVLVEKRAVEVNAFADELAASPRIHGGTQVRQDSQRGAMVRRATTQVPSTTIAGAQITPSRALQVASGKRPEQIHHRQNSYERRYRDTTSATSAISKAINMASGRLFSMGFSPPLGLGRGGPSPPSYNPFPSYPTTQGSLVLIGDGTKGQGPMDEDTKVFHLVEEGATRSDVVYCFAEVKYKQLIPLAPSTERGLGIRQTGTPEAGEAGLSVSEDSGLTVDAIVTLSEEALVLYVKALSLLARSMDIANAWWSRKNRGEVIESASPRTQANPTKLGNRINNVVQWVRGRFNDVLEKAEFVRLKLIEAQKQLPEDHPSHPKNQSSSSSSATGMGKSADNVYVSPGTTAEKLMYDRALEMSRAAAVNELVGEDLPGCEISYLTAIRMLEAVLQDDEESGPKKGVATDPRSKGSKSEGGSINGVEAEDREVVLKRK